MLLGRHLFHLIICYNTIHIHCLTFFRPLGEHGTPRQSDTLPLIICYRYIIPALPNAHSDRERSKRPRGRPDPFPADENLPDPHRAPGRQPHDDRPTLLLLKVLDPKRLAAIQ